MIKSYTDISQSNKLAKILPLESADMCYQVGEDLDGYLTKTIYTPLMHTPYNDDYIPYNEYYIPCWSLAALLELLPKKLEIMDNVYELSVYFYGLYYWNIVNGNPCFESKDKNNLVDACVAMIEKLHNLNLL